MNVPVRVDFAGGWLDVPLLSNPNGYIVNCTIIPMVNLANWPYEKNAGIGGSAAWALLTNRNPVQSEKEAGVGWQDPAVILETGLCVWHSGVTPRLFCKYDPHPLLSGRIGIVYTGKHHITADLVRKTRNYRLILDAGKLASMAVQLSSILMLGQAVDLTYEAQIDEGMDELPSVSGANRKYAGSGWGGYAMYLFEDKTMRDSWVSSYPNAMAVEPYMRNVEDLYEVFKSRE